MLGLKKMPGLLEIQRCQSTRHTLVSHISADTDNSLIVFS